MNRNTGYCTRPLVLPPFLVILLVLLLFFASTQTYSQVGINTTSPDASSMLDVTATDKGILVPRISLNDVATTMLDGTNTAATGLLIYNTNAAVTGGSGVGFYYFNGTTWEKLISGTASTEKIDDLLDGKSDNDGSQDGSSVFLGMNAGMNDDSSDNRNIGIGFETLQTSATSFNNSAIGYQSLYSNTTGSGNAANGYQTLRNNTIGNWNVANGNLALFSNTGGNNNTANGNESLYSNTNGFNNTSSGYESMYLNTTGSDNTAIGMQSLYTNSIGSNNAAFGIRAMYLNTEGIDNTATGNRSLYSNTTGRFNTAHGSNALFSNTIGEFNTATGYQALLVNTEGINNVATGSRSLASNTTGSDNVANGFRALYTNVNGAHNNAIGSFSQFFNASGSHNLAIGFQSLLFNSSGSYNIGIGSNTGASNSSGSNNIYLGHSAGTPETGSNKLYIENSGANADNALIYGEFDANILRTNSQFQIGNPTGTGFAFPTVDGTANQIMQTDGSGAISWVDGTTLGSDDHDFYEEGTTNAPNDITDDIFTQGNVAIGATSSNYPLQITTDNRVRGINISQTTNGTSYGMYITNTGSSTGGGLYGTYNLINSTSFNADKYGSYQNVAAGANATSYGSYNNLVKSVGSGAMYGSYQNLADNGGSSLYGTYSNLIGTGGGGDKYGAYNKVTNSGNSINHGSYNLLDGSGSNFQFGIYNKIPHTGNGFHFGTYNDIDGGGTGGHYGVQNRLRGSGTGMQTGTVNQISNSGNSEHNATRNILSGSGTGDKYGTKTTISQVAGGTHYGLYSEVLKSASYAGYFLGDVSIGTTTANNYIFPASRGTNNQVMQADGSGNLSWVDGSSLGSEDADWYEEGTTSAPNSINDDIFTQGNVGIGTTNPSYALDLTETDSQRGLNINITGSNTGVSYGAYIHNDNTNGSGNFGLYTLASGITSGDKTSIFNEITNTGNSTHTGTLNTLSGTGSGVKVGTSNIIDGTAGGTHYGTRNHLSSSASSRKYGSWNFIPTTAGGSHYGVYSRVETSGSFAGFFIGTVAIGTQSELSGTPDRYMLPPSRGTDGQIMQINGSGFVSWVTPSFTTGATNGLSLSGADVILGGALTQTTTITQGNNDLNVDLTGTGDFQINGNSTNDILFADGGNNVIRFGSQAGNLFNNGTVVSGITLDYVADFDNAGAGTTIGVGSAEYIADAGSNRIMLFGSFFPATDNSFDLGSSTQRWDDVYATSGIVNTSDIRLKKNVNELGYGLKEILKITPISYQWKESNNGETKLGFSAQDLQQILPEVVKTNDVEISEKDGSIHFKPNKTLGVYYSDIIPVTVKAIQEQQLQIEALKKENKKLEDRLAAIEVILQKD